MRLVALTLALALLSAPPSLAARFFASPEAAMNAFEADFADETGMTISEAIADHEVGGAAVVLIRGETLVTRTYGLRNVARGWPVNERTVFDAASLSKMVAALGFLRAAREQEISLDIPLNAFVRRHPDGLAAAWQEAHLTGALREHGTGITVRRLLAHAGGLDMHGIGLRAPEDPCNRLETLLLGFVTIGGTTHDIEGCEGVPVKHAPGELVDYSGGGYTLAEAMFLDAVEEPLGPYLNRAVLDAYGLAQSSFDDMAHKPSLARGCSRGNCLTAFAQVLPLFMTRIKAAGGMVAHPEDYARLVQLILNDGYDSDEQDVIPEADIAQLLTPVSHIDAPARSCAVRPAVCATGPKAAPGDACVAGQCLRPLPYENSGNRWYGLGVKLGHEILADGLPRIFEHGGAHSGLRPGPEEAGYRSFFYADRATGNGVVAFVSGAYEWGPDEKGAKALADALYDAYIDRFLVD